MRETFKGLTLKQKLAKIDAACKDVFVEFEQDREELKVTILNACSIGPNLTKELVEHSVLYAHFALQLEVIEFDIATLTLDLDKKKERLADIYEFIVAACRISSEKITAEQKKEILALLRLERFIDSEYYSSMVNACTDEDKLEANEGLIGQYGQLLRDIEAGQNKLLDFQYRKNLLSQILQCFAYQRIRCLDDLTSRETTGLRMQKGVI